MTNDLQNRGFHAFRTVVNWTRVEWNPSLPVHGKGLAVSFDNHFRNLRADDTVSISAGDLSRRILRMRGKRMASPLLWRALG